MPFENKRSVARLFSSRSANTALSVALTAVLGLAVRSSVSAAPRAPQTTEAPAKVCEALHVNIVVDGQTKSVQTSPSTVSDLLAAQNIHLGKLDRCSLSPASMIGDGSTITITRVRAEIVVVKTPIAFPTKQTYTSALSVGSKSVKQAGVKGEHVVRYRCTYVEDKETSRVKQSEATTAAKTQIELVGTRGMTLASRGYFGGRRVIEMVATGYGPGGNGKWGARTSSGLRPGFGVVAVDPQFIPLGTRLYIEGYGYAVAGDTGGAIKGARIDLGRDTNAEAMAEGRKKVRVLILN